MKVTYYPGCSLEGTARDYADSIQSVCASLDLQLEEIPDWNCCGATAAHSIDQKAGIDLPGRNLNLAAGLSNPDMLVPCPLCFNRLRTAAHELSGANAASYRTRLEPELPKIWDLATFFGSPAMIGRISEAVRRPLDRLKVVCYYGCMASRPPHITGALDYENPQSIDRIVRATGATALAWPYKTDCCGASLMFSRPSMAQRMIGKLYDMAKAVGAQAIVVSCQMCQSNLDMYQDRTEAELGRKFSIPVLYFTELIGAACGLPETGSWLSRHFVDPVPALRSAGVQL